MDELLDHCIRELAFEGDLGCDVSRLRDFVTDFYEHNGSTQNVDDAYCGFVWSIVAQQPEVRIGLAPEGAPEVYVAPQAIKTGSKAVIGSSSPLEVIPDAARKSLEELRAQYGDSLRIVVEPERTFVAITGSHSRPSKLTATVYTCLQLAARGRERGISAVDLSKKTGYDAKTVHYLVDKLVQLDLVVKRKKAGVGANMCIHKYFFERSLAWQGVVAEEEQAMEQMKQEADEDEPVSSAGLASLRFDPIDSRHLSSLPVVQARIEKLLRNSPHQTHSLKNLIITLGFANPSRMDRNFFLTRIRELESNGVIERVEIPREKGKPVTCIRLLSQTKQDDSGSVEESPMQNHELEEEPTAPKANVDFHRQLLDQIYAVGIEGTTLNDISKSLGDLDRRIIDHQLNRLKDIPVPPHLRDYEIQQISESFGRERRYRYFCAIHYHKLAEQEQFDSPYAKGFFDHVAEFAHYEGNMFYSSAEEFNTFVDNYRAARDEAAGKQKKPIGRPKKQGVKRKRGDDTIIGEEASAPPAKKKRTSKKAITAPPPQSDDATVDVQDTANGEASVSAPVSAPKRRGRLPKAKPPVDPDAPPKKRGRPKKTETEEPKVPKKRGRPPKKKPAAEEPPASETAQSQAEVVPDVIAPEAEVDGPQPSPLIQGEDEPPAHPPSEKPPQPVTSDITDEEVTEELAACPSTPEPLAEPLAEPHYTGAMEVDQGQVAESPQPHPQSQTPAPPTIPSTLIDPALLELEGAIAHPPPAEISQPSSTVGPSTSLEGLISFDDEPSQSVKRPSSPGSSAPPPSKRIKADTTLNTRGSRGRTNISHIRRRKELLQVIQNLGGITSLSSKEFHEAHAALMESLTKAGEATSSGAGGKIDRRTINATLNELENQGLVKQLTTVITSTTGYSRPVKIAYLVETSQEDLNAFLGELSRTQVVPQPPAVKRLETSIEYGGKPVKAVRQHLSPPPSEHDPSEDESEVVSQLVQSEDEIIRSNMLNEPNTILQQYGFIVGKIVRAKALHLHILELLQERTHADIVSADQRIVHLQYFFHNMPIGMFCSVVSVRIHSEELLRLLSTEEGRKTPVSSLSAYIIDLCELNRSQARTKMLELLSVLQQLQLLTPLRFTNSDQPLVRCSPNGDHPTAFEETHVDPSTTSAAPQYWVFSTKAPIHMWAWSDSNPPFYEMLAVRTPYEGAEFWHQLQLASLDEKHCRSLLPSRLTEQSAANTHTTVDTVIRKLLRRQAQWRTTYNFSWQQKDYLRRFVDPADATTPLEDPDHGTARLAHIAHVVCAPVAEVAQFYEHERHKMLRDMGKIKQTRRNAQRTEDDKEMLAQKAAEARAQRKKDWEDMVVRVHPAPLKSHEQARIRTIRHRFLQSSGTDLRRWEREIEQAIQDAKLPARFTTNAPPLASVLPGRVGAPPPPSVPSNEKSVEELIERQIALPPAPAKLSKKERKKLKELQGSDGPDLIKRRSRFNWTKDYDELALDAAAIIRARCRDGKRVEWSAVEALFPCIDRNSVRQRVVKLREEPGAESYMKRLEDKWYELWMRYLNTPELPDDDPGSVTNFDIIAHVKFLRSHIDKVALRIGIVEKQEQSVPTMALPTSVDAITEQWDVVEKPIPAPSYDFLWSGQAEESRERLFMRCPLVLGGNEVPAGLEQYTSEKTYTADAALKMTLATSNDAYDADSASRLLKSVGDEAVQTAVHSLSKEGVISMIVRDPRKSRPGRTYKISDINQNMLVGFFPTELYQDAEEFEEALAENDGKEWGEWPLLSSDGDIAALLELVSENKVDFKVDLTHFQSVRSAIDWNSKKADDDLIETDLFVRLKEPQQATKTTEADDATRDEDMVDVSTTAPTGPHGTTADGKLASCKLSTTGPVDCAVCLESSLADLQTSSDPNDIIVLDHLVQQLNEAGRAGLSRKQLATIYPRYLDKLSVLIGRLVEASPSLAFWTGYNEVVLVSANYVDEWTVVASQDDTRCSRVFPRRWLDIHGRRMNDVWDAACKAVTGTVWLHPGIAQNELRWRLRSVYNRQEVEDVLRHLHDEGHLQRVVRCEGWWCEGPPGNAEEGSVLWTVSKNRRWYQV